MTQYINKDALVAEIKRRMDENSGKQSLPQYFGMIEEDLNILSFIDTLEMKEFHTDAFIEKAEDYIKQHWIWNRKMIEDFKNYMSYGTVY